MTRRQWIWLTPAILLGTEGTATVRGRLLQEDQAASAIKTPDGRIIRLKGDRETIAVLHDARLSSDDFEAIGQWAGAEEFEINPIHLRAMFVYRGGKRLVITYWCAICSIRSYSPGRCVCCQEETDLDPRDPALKDTDPTQ
jgi:hypothetical protein